ncbi:MAG: cellulase family glycosylhydrolase [Bacteroidota bacterium]|nr:cellulase family glycosylhydrolase [Bacteroidota bacterium]
MLFIRIILIFLLFLSEQLYAQNFLKTDGKKIVNDKGEVLLRGIGLGGWMLQEPYMLQLSGVAGTQHEIKNKIAEVIGKERSTTFYNAWLANHCRKADIDSLAAWGFNSIRLPMHYNLFTLSVDEEPVPGKNTFIANGFTLVDSLLSWCKKDHIYLILDLHATPGGQGNDNAIADRDSSKLSLWQSEANRQKTIALWKELAKRYANEPWIGGYDLINEPNWGFENSEDKNGLKETKNEPLKKLLISITSEIRQVDKNHIIIIEGNGWGNNYNAMFPLWDKNMVVSFHKYWNYNDQGSIKNYIKIRDEQNVPVWCGETGENFNAWFTDAISLFEKNNIGWAWWPLKKIGINNPMEVKLNESYQQLINYWKGTAPKPSAVDAYMALMQLTQDIKAENTFVHKDVIDAMFRQIHSDEAISFKQHLVKNKTIVFAADYDLGKNGVAYFDKDTADYHVSTGVRGVGNKGRMYRNDGVDIYTCSDATTNGYGVLMEAGEWLQYTLTPAEGIYDLEIRTASTADSSKLVIVINNSDKKIVALPATGSDKNWITTSIKNIHLYKGINRLRVIAEQGEFRVNYFQFTNLKKENIKRSNNAKAFNNSK